MQALGGAKNHMIVLPDADIDMAADAAVSAGYGSAGERCMAISVVVAVGDAADPLVGAIKDRLPKVKVGDGLDPSSEMGPLVTREHRDKVASYLESGPAQGATLVADGRETAPDNGGFFLGVSLLDDVTPEMDAYRDEIFGPVLSVVRVGTLRRGAPARERQPVRERRRALHARRRRRAPVPVRRQRRHGRRSTCRSRFPSRTTRSAAGRTRLFGDRHIYGPEGIDFYTRTKAVTSRWPDPATSRVDLGFPQTGRAAASHLPTSSRRGGRRASQGGVRRRGRAGREGLQHPEGDEPQPGRAAGVDELYRRSCSASRGSRGASGSSSRRSPQRAELPLLNGGARRRPPCRGRRRRDRGARDARLPQGRPLAARAGALRLRGEADAPRGRGGRADGGCVPGER